MAKKETKEQPVISKEDKQILKAFNESGMDLKSFKALYKQPKPKPGQTYKLGGSDVNFGVITDSHTSSKDYEPRGMDLAAKVFKKEKVDFVTHIGDICDGLYTNRPGHIFELVHLGADDQVDYACEELSKIQQPIYAITGNHTWNTFFKNAGMDIGLALENKLDHFNYLGNGEGNIEINHGKKIQLLHPDGGTAYALSYRPQKIAEAMEGGTKPAVCLIGHFHKAEYLFYRNIHMLQGGTLQHQTKFMKGKHIPAHMGFWTIRMKVAKDGVKQITPTFYPIY